MKKLVFVLIFWFIPVIAMAAQGASKCGFGHIVPGKGIVSQTLAQTANAMFGILAATSVTSKTSGCKYSDLVQLDNLRELYLEFNFAQLQEDAAKGDGAYLTGLAELMGCTREGEKQLNHYLQQHFEHLFVSPPWRPQRGRVIKIVKRAYHPFPRIV